MRNAGKRAIVLIVAVALAAALFSLWYHRESGRRSIEYWGAEGALLIARAPQIVVLKLQPADAPRPARPSTDDEPAGAAPPENPPPGSTPNAGENGRGSDAGEDRPIQRLGIGGRFYVVATTRDASQARGMSNIRRAMVLDATYRWDDDGGAHPPTWQYALEFREGGRTAMALFDFKSGRVGTLTNPRTLLLDPAAISDWRGFFEEQFARASGGDNAPQGSR
jgi:hypothetical protein